MSSIIVLDSSDEDEAPPPKRIYLSPIPATTTKIKSKSVISISKPRQIPRGITVTARASPVSDQSERKSPKTSLLQNPKAKALPKPPPLQPAPHLQQAQLQHRSVTPPKALTSPLPLKTSSTFLSMLSTDSSMTASVTPPIKLLATPPHTTDTLNDPIMLSPRLITANQPHLVTITPQPVMCNKLDGCMSPLVPAPSPKSPTNGQASKSATPRRIVPTTVLKRTDGAWLEKCRRQITCMGDDGVLEVVPSASNQKTQSLLKPPEYKPKINKPKNSLPLISQVSLTGSQQKTVGTSSPLPPKTIRASRELPQISSSTKSKVAPPCITPNPSSDVTKTSVKFDSVPVSEIAKNSFTVIASTKSKLNGNIALTDIDSIKKDPDTPGDSKKLASLQPEYEELLKTCREAESSDDMEKLINKKLIRYYYEVHPDFVKSRGFRKSIRNVIDRIRANPELVYYNLKTVVDELNVRRKCKTVVIENTDEDEEELPESVVDKRTNEQIHKLNKALKILTVRIKGLEEAEVDWDDDDSSYLQVERYKKRACKIYEKICQLTGENKNAHRVVKQSIQYKGTEYEQFNKTLQAYVNHTKEFPDFYDVLKMLEHCNRKYNYNLMIYEMKNIAFTAFKEVGRLLQHRRKADLYETVVHFTANVKDPAESDPELFAKLGENQKNQRKISEVIEKYAREQELISEKVRETRLQEKQKANNSNDSTGDEEDKNGKDVEIGVEELGKVTKRNFRVEDEFECGIEIDNKKNEESTDNGVEDLRTLENGDISDDKSDTNEKSNEFKHKTTSSTVASGQQTSIKRLDIADRTDNKRPITPEIGYDTTHELDSLIKNSPNKTVNNNIMRIKTIETVLVKAPVESNTKPPSPTPNGKMKPCMTPKATPLISLKKPVISETVGLKIVSVSSLACADLGLEQPSKENRGSVKNPTKQHTVAEIVISDEES